MPLAGNPWITEAKMTTSNWKDALRAIKVPNQRASTEQADEFLELRAKVSFAQGARVKATGHNELLPPGYALQEDRE